MINANFIIILIKSQLYLKIYGFFYNINMLKYLGMFYKSTILNMIIMEVIREKQIRKRRN